MNVSGRRDVAEEEEKHAGCAEAEEEEDKEEKLRRGKLFFCRGECGGVG